MFPGHWPLCSKEAASQAGGPKIAVYVCPWMRLSITARPLPLDASFLLLALIGPLGVEQGSRFCCLGLWPLKGPIVTTWKGGLWPDLESAREPFLQGCRKVCTCRLCVTHNGNSFLQPWSIYFFRHFSLRYVCACVLCVGYVHISGGTWGVQKRATNPLELEL